MIRIWRFGSRFCCLKADFSKNNSLVLNRLINTVDSVIWLRELKTGLKAVLCVCVSRALAS